MFIARAGAALLVFSLGALPAAGAEPSAPAANRMLAGSSVEEPASSAMQLAADTRTTASKEQLRSRSAQQGSTEDRVAKLEQRVAELEAQVGRLLSILEVDGQDVTIRGRKISIEGQQSLDLRAAQTTMESQAGLRLKGASITLNGGSKPIARVGSAVSAGVVSNGASTVLAP